MTFTETKLPGMFVIESDVYPDDRGSFEAAWHREELARRSLDAEVAQVSIAANLRRGTLRGLHYQAPPFQEAKIVRVTRGLAWDVAVDLRPDSPTYRQWCGLELSAETRRMVYIPRGFAHGYQTLSDDTEVLYFVSAAYSREHQRGIRWDDPALAIAWPIRPPAVLSERDAALPHCPA
ncbi:MAG TPA: dTDP-4-dehydrorhamnose 3,5-epimerase [Vicinamibacterales bacterium]|nr:dTDP-4-dehydrorhamnose 3,5-epimerase [Vicinamibacterales bacterium]